MSTRSLRNAVIVLMFFSLAFIIWNDFLFNSRMDENIKEMIQALDKTKMPSEQTQAISNALNNSKRYISSFGSRLMIYLLPYLALIAILEQILKKEKKSIYKENDSRDSSHP